MSKRRGLEELMGMLGSMGGRNPSRELTTGIALACINEKGIKEFKELIDQMVEVCEGNNIKVDVTRKFTSCYFNKKKNLFSVDLSFKLTALVDNDAKDSDGDDLTESSQDAVMKYLKKMAKDDPKPHAKHDSDDE